MLLLGEGESGTISTEQGELRWQCLSSVGMGCGRGVWGSQRDELGWMCSKSALYMCGILEGQIKMIILSFVKIIFTYFEVLN